MNIKVQIDNVLSAKSLLASGIENAHKPVTFIAYSDAMKARVLQRFLEGRERIGLCLCEGRKDGEWREDFAPNAVFNK